jgi:hypothetical protein
VRCRDPPAAGRPTFDQDIDPTFDQDIERPEIEVKLMIR